MYHLYVTTDIYRICQILVARFRIWGGLSNALGRLSLPKPPRGAGAETDVQMQTDFIICPMLYAIAMGHIIKPSAFLHRAAMFNVSY